VKREEFRGKWKSGFGRFMTVSSHSSGCSNPSETGERWVDCVDSLCLLVIIGELAFIVNDNVNVRPHINGKMY